MKPQYLSNSTRDKVMNYIRTIELEKPFKVVFKPSSQRSLEQNDKIQAMCTDISDQVVLDTTHGGYTRIDNCKFFKKFSHNDWRHILMAGFTKSEVVPGLEQGQAVCLYPSTTDLSLTKGADFIEYIYSVGADYDVVWTEQ